MRILVNTIVLLSVIVAAGCQAGALDDLATPEVTSSPDSAPLPASTTQETTTPGRITTATKLPELVPSNEATAQVLGEVPSQLLNSITNDLAERTGAAPEKIVVTQAQSVVWSDGSLGCPQPGMFYTQALVNGYWVILEFEGQDYDYRVATRGYFFLCESGHPPLQPLSTPNSW